MVEPSGRERIDVSSLLTIDVESELRKLTQAQLQGPWQLPAELVRRAIRRGADLVEVEFGRAQLVVRSRGGAVPADVLRELSALLDGQRSPERRHRALSALERAGALSLLGLVGLDPAALSIVSPGAHPSGDAMGLSWRRGKGVEYQRFAGDTQPEQTQISVRGSKLDRGRARTWLSEVARYASVDIRVDGKPLRRAARVTGGFDDPFSVTRISAPFQATLALPREGELARLYLLQDGLVSTHMSVTNSPAFEAAVETTQLCEATASAALLRDAVQPHIKAIMHAAIEHMIELGRGGGSLPLADRSRLTQLLLYTARRYRERAKVIARLPLFRGLERDGRERWYDLLSLRQSASDEAGERLLCALFPDQELGDFAPEGRVYILDEAQRAQLGELLELGFRPPPRRVEGRRGLLRLLREGPSLRRLGDLLALLRPGGRSLPDSELRDDERQLLHLLRAQLGACEVSMCTGGGSVRRIGKGPAKLLLPRESEQVRAAVVSVTGDPAWIYPALLTLLGGRDMPMRARRRWSALAGRNRA